MVVISGTTKNIETVYLVEVLVNRGLSKPTKFQADSIFTIEKEELGEKITTVSTEMMNEINRALQIELNLE